MCQQKVPIGWKLTFKRSKVVTSRVTKILRNYVTLDPEHVTVTKRLEPKPIAKYIPNKVFEAPWMHRGAVGGWNHKTNTHHVLTGGSDLRAAILLCRICKISLPGSTWGFRFLLQQANLQLSLSQRQMILNIDPSPVPFLPAVGHPIIVGSSRFRYVKWIRECMIQIFHISDGSWWGSSRTT